MGWEWGREKEEGLIKSYVVPLSYFQLIYCPCPTQPHYFSNYLSKLKQFSSYLIKGIWQIEILALNIIKSIVTGPSCDQYLHSVLCYKYTPWYFFFPWVELRRTTHTTTTAPVSNPNTSRNMTTMNQAVW